MKIWKPYWAHPLMDLLLFVTTLGGARWILGSWPDAIGMLVVVGIFYWRGFIMSGACMAQMVADGWMVVNKPKADADMRKRSRG